MLSFYTHFNNNNKKNALFQIPSKSLVMHYLPDLRIMFYGVQDRSWSTYYPTISPVFTSVYWAKPLSNQKQWKLKGNKLGSFPFFTLSCHCLNEKPHWDVTSFCKQHYIEWPSESQCPTENPLSNWDKIFLKGLIIVWFRDLYTLPLQRVSLDLATWFFLQRTRVQAISDVLPCHYLLLFNHWIPSASFEVTWASLMDCIDFSENRWDGGLIYLLNHSTCLTIFFHF